MIELLAGDLKKYIIDNDKTLELITLLGCSSIRDYGDKFQCARPLGDNPTGMVIWKDNLNVKIYTPHDGTGDIFTLVMATYKIDFIDALKKVHELLDIDFKGTFSKKSERKDPLKRFKRISRSKKYANDYDQELYTEEQLGDFINIPHISWIKDGILPFVMDEFNIGYDFNHSRITIPWRGLDVNESRYVGCVGRTTIDNYKELGIPKYWAYNNFNKSHYLYALAENYKHIQREGLVVVTESEKSPLKAASRLIRNFVAVGGHSISQRQRQILISLDVEVCVSWDSDISLYDVLDTCELFYGLRKVSFTYDSLGCLGEKESVGDLPRKDMIFMVESREEYNAKWRKEYLKMKKEREDNRKKGLNVRRITGTKEKD